jgi:hypothetical protein
MVALRLAPSLVALASLVATVGCSVDGADFDDAFYGEAREEEPDADAEEPTRDEDDDDDDEPMPQDDEPAPSGFAHEGTFSGTCTMEDREAFQVDLALDKWGRGTLRRHDIGPVELDAAGVSVDGVTTVEAVRDGVLFVVNIHEDAEGMDAECLELEPTEGEGDGIDCMFTEIGCPHDETSWSIVAAGDLDLVRT